jgi:hypothetical protein
MSVVGHIFTDITGVFLDYLKEVSHENYEGSKVASIEKSSFRDVSAGSF